jgi:TadE-like protein
MVEAAIVLPVLLTLVLGLAECGFLFRQYLTTSNASRAGARVGSSAGTSSLADYDILQGVAGAAASLPSGSLQYVVVFKSAGPNSAVPALCVAGTPVSGVCNVYPAADLALDSAALAATGHSNSWPPASRQARQSVGTDWLGVYVRTEYDYLTNMFSGSRPLNDTAIMRIEPESN